MNDVNKGKKANMKRLLMTMGAALGVAWTGRAEMKEMTWRIPLMEKAPVIDGTVDPAEWAGAHGSFGFVRYPTDTVAPIRSAFFVGRTKDRLYLAGLGKVGPTGLARAVKARKGNVDCFSDDTYEIVLVPDAAKGVPDIRHVIVNYNGAYRTQALLDNKMAAFLPETMVTKSAERDGWWHFEWSIALDEIGFAQTPDDRHAIRFCRNFKRVENQWGFQSSMRPDERGFFAAGRAVPSAFDDGAVAVQLVAGDETDASRWNLTLRLHNPTATAATVEAKVEGRPVNSQPGVTLKTVTLQPGETVELPVSGPVLGDEKVTLVTDVRQDGKTVFFREIGWRPNGPAPQWLKAGEDGSGVKFDFAFYPSHNRMRLRADLTTIEKRPKTVRVELRNDENRGRNVLAETTLTLDADGVADVLWDIPDLKAVTQKTGVGGYTLTLVAEGVKKGTLTRAFRRDVFDWEGFTGGTSDTVPSMFEPVKRWTDASGAAHVGVVLRDHTIGEHGLWRQVLADGKPLLARPMRLTHPTSPSPAPRSPFPPHPRLRRDRRQHRRRGRADRRREAAGGREGPSGHRHHPPAAVRRLRHAASRRVEARRGRADAHNPFTCRRRRARFGNRADARRRKTHQRCQKACGRTPPPIPLNSLRTPSGNRPSSPTSSPDRGGFSWSRT